MNKLKIVNNTKIAKDTKVYVEDQDGNLILVPGIRKIEINIDCANIVEGVAYFYADEIDLEGRFKFVEVCYD